MRLDLFSKGDSVLLLGEGNFSFAVGLHKLRLPIKITATCFQSQPKSERELQNIEYLQTNDIPVFFNVDATKLQENSNFINVKFTKLIFNFPHVGGKMKIHLNRQLLRNFFLSAGHVLEENGSVLVSLCRGQGGTPADCSQRRWDDTWQIVEMAAEGDFILSDVEPFLKQNFLEYECVGYRSQNVSFHLDGALVHIFKKKPFDAVSLPTIYDELYRRYPTYNPDSGISYLRKILIECFNKQEVEVVDKPDGIQSDTNSINFTDIFPTLNEFPDTMNFNKKVYLYSSMNFRNSGADFLSNAPVDFKFIILGKNLRSEMLNFLNRLISIFKEQYAILSGESTLICKNKNTGSEMNVVDFHEFRGMEICVVSAQSICEFLFGVGWKQIWTDHKVALCEIPVIKPALLHPSLYQFDMTLRYKKPFSDEDLLRQLWLGGGLLIEGVKLLNEYASENWSSKCYRISYRSLDRPMYRNRVIEIHAKLGRVLEAGLDVTSLRVLPGNQRTFKIQIRWFSNEDFQPVAVRPKKPKAKGISDFKFVDNHPVEAIGGKGGDGCISFLRLSINDRAGPDGGDGGNGGHVIFKATTNVRDLSHLVKVIKAPDGERGFNKDCNGKSGKHEYVKVPVGTLIKNQSGVIVGDLSTEGAMFIAARGGAGGRGNHFFTSDTMQSPEVAEFGAEGEKLRYHLELKTMAHIGLVGMPNAGKSTLLRAITRARPKVAPYAFTTLTPNLGIIQYSDYEQVTVADLPGLIEGSHKNKGLGIEFLRHAERCRGILFVIDLSVNDPEWQYETLKFEISQFNEDLLNRPFAVVGNKIDLTSARNNLVKFQSTVDCPVIAISAKMGNNLTELLKQIRLLYDTHSEETENEMSC